MACGRQYWCVYLDALRKLHGAVYLLHWYYVTVFPTNYFLFCSYTPLTRTLSLIESLSTILGRAQDKKLLISCFSSTFCYSFSARFSQSRTSVRVRHNFYTFDMTAGGSTLNKFTIEISLKRSIFTAWHAFEMLRFYFYLFVKSTSGSIPTYINALSAVIIFTYLLRDK